MPVDYRDIAPEHARFRFCPLCAGPLEDRTDEVNERLRPTCVACGWTYYPTNLNGGLVVAETGDHLLVISPPDADGGGLALPGGIAEYGETPEECVIRETKEEAGLTISDVQEITRSLIHGVFGPMLYFGFRARISGGQMREGDEGRPSLVSKDDLSRVAPNRVGSRRVLEAYLAQV